MKKVYSIIFILIMVLVSGCEDTPNNDSGVGAEGVTPIDNKSAYTLYGTYNITAYTVANNGVETKYSGDNVTGEIVINSSEIRYRLEYDDGKYSYYSFNLLDSQSSTTYNNMINSLLKNENGNAIKNSNEIVLNNFEAKKVSNTPKDLIKDVGYSGPYKDNRLTPLKTGDVWNITGTYHITKVRRIIYGGGLTEIDMSKGSIGFIAFGEEKGRFCNNTTLYKIWSSELTTIYPYVDNGMPNNCSGTMMDNYTLRLEIIESNNDSYTFTLTKLYDAIGF